MPITEWNSKLMCKCVNLLTCPTSAKNLEWEIVLEWMTFSTVTVLCSVEYSKNYGQWGGKSKLFSIHTEILQNELNSCEWQRRLNEKYKALELVQPSGSSSGVRKSGTHWVILLNQNVEVPSNEEYLRNKNKQKKTLYIFCQKILNVFWSTNLIGK